MKNVKKGSGIGGEGGMGLKQSGICIRGAACRSPVECFVCHKQLTADKKQLGNCRGNPACSRREWGGQ